MSALARAQGGCQSIRAPANRRKRRIIPAALLAQGRPSGGLTDAGRCSTRAPRWLLPASLTGTSTSAVLRSLTQGRGSFTMELSHYEELPRPLQEKLIAERAKLRKAEVEAE